MDKFIHIKDQSINPKRKLLSMGLILGKLCSAASSGHVMILKTVSQRETKLSTVGR